MYIKIFTYVILFIQQIVKDFIIFKSRGRGRQANKAWLREGAYPVEERKYSLFTQLRRQSGIRPTIARRISLAAISRNSVQLASL